MKWILFVFAWVSLLLGVIGAFLPILPTTPFLILSAYLFSKSSPRFHNWILSLPYAGEAILDWRANRVIKTKAKILCVSMITVSLTGLWVYSAIHLVVKILITAVLFSVASFVVTRKGHLS